MLTVQRRNTSKSLANCVREKIQTEDFPFTKDCLSCRQVGWYLISHEISPFLFTNSVFTTQSVCVIITKALE